MKQTAVEWLIDQILFDNDIIKPNQWENKYQGGVNLSKYVKKALKMEKEQIIDAYETSHISMMTAQQYCKETFNK